MKVTVRKINHKVYESMKDYNYGIWQGKTMVAARVTKKEADKAAKQLRCGQLINPIS
jgi:hypothetical protein